MMAILIPVFGGDCECSVRDKKWHEEPYSKGPGHPRLTRASVTKTYTGDIKGEAQVEYLMM